MHLYRNFHIALIAAGIAIGLPAAQTEKTFNILPGANGVWINPNAKTNGIDTFIIVNATNYAIRSNQFTCRISVQSLSPETRTNLVNDLCAGGYVCAIKGHNWRWGRPGEGIGVMYADYHPNVNYRTCDVCGQCQSQTLEWK